QPRCNVLLKSGQPFLYIFISSTADLPTLTLVRNQRAKGTYFGPFLEKGSARKVYDFLIKTFRLKMCGKRIENGCLFYHLGQCAGSCRSDFDRQGMDKYGHAKEKTISWSSSAYKNQSFQYLEAEGRLLVDLLPIVKRDEQGQEFDGFHDPEQRHRMRYVDLVVNPEVREVFRKRARMIQLMRDFFNERGFLEVETPILQPIYGGAAARPFTTHHNTLDMKLYLRIANELYLKRLIVGGFDGVYEFARDFRNEGMSRYHNPEFTQVELYAAYRDYRWMMDMTEELIEYVAMGLHGTTEVVVGDQKINFARPWARYTWHGAIEAFAGLDLRSLSDKALLAEARTLGVDVPESATRPALLDEIFGHCVEQHLIQPTFITDYPVEMSPLAKRHADNPELTERFELICNRKELANAFSELNDPDDQRARFEAQIELGKRGDAEAMMPDEDFLRALEYGMPPTAGIGIGIDRLSMIMTNQNSIQEVLLFPHMRPEHGRAESVDGR
ncbi:MAG: lysine--tRNA ligase, partial [Bacteroidetes bacterium]|nr:lysine--tRNA ligase [Bacteroidota bacterium]